MKILELDQQKRAILYAPKDLLWAILDEDEAWLKLFKVLPNPYYTQFLSRLRLLGVEEDEAIKNMAKMYVQNKVKLDHLQEAIASIWNPDDLEDSTSWLKENGFINRPLMPMNLQASTKKDPSNVTIIKEALAMPIARKRRLVKEAGRERPKMGKPPAGASKDGLKCWNRILRDKDKRKIITSPNSLEDQWSLAIKFWSSECARQGKDPYETEKGVSSYSTHTSNMVRRSLDELRSGLCSDGYSMARPAARKFKSLVDQLKKDGYDLGKWEPLKPKRHGEV